MTMHWWKFGIYVWLATVITLAMFSQAIVPGLGETTKNTYFHVSMSFTATVAFFLSMWHSIQFLRTRNLDNDLNAEAAAGLGFLFNVLAMITGAIWARFTWGQFWNWDPKQTAIFVLLLIYAAYFALRSSVETAEKRARLASVYNIFAFPSALFLYFILPRLMPGLHPGAMENGQMGTNPAVSNTTSPEIRILLYTSFAGFLALFLWLWNVRVRQLRLQHTLDMRLEPEPVDGSTTSATPSATGSATKAVSTTIGAEV